MTHDFKTAIVELHGVTQTHRLIQPYGGKNIDVLCKLFAESIESGKRNPSLSASQASVSPVKTLLTWPLVSCSRKLLCIFCHQRRWRCRMRRVPVTVAKSLAKCCIK